MLEYKSILGIVSVLIAFAGYGIYFRQIFSGKIKPHAFSWFVWGLTTAIIFFGQLAKGAGPGAWATGAIAVACWVIFSLAIFKGQRSFVYWDWIFLLAALISLVSWKLTKDPTLALILLTATDALATLPTLRKAYHKPLEESLALFSLNGIKSIFSILAFQIYTFVAVLYPVMLVLFNSLVALIIFLRRRQLLRGQGFGIMDLL